MAVSLSIISAALFHNCSVSSTEPRLTYCGFFKVLHRIKMIPCLALKTLSDHVWQFFAFLADTVHWTNCFRGLKSVITLKFFSVLQLQDQQYIYLNSVFWSCVTVHLSIMKFIWHIFVSSLHFARCFKLFCTSVAFENLEVHELGDFIANSLPQVINEGVE